MRGTQIEVWTGRKWSASKELAVVEKRFNQKASVGITAKGRKILGFFPSIQGQEKRKMPVIANKVRAGVEEDRYCKMVGPCQQGVWTKWEGIVQHKINWSDCWNTNFSCIQFFMKSVYDILPITANEGKATCPTAHFVVKEQFCNIF